MADFKIAETESFSKKIAGKEYISVYKKIKTYIYPQLKENPFFGLNIKKLKGNLSEMYRYRIRTFRIFYLIDLEKKIVFMLDISKRKDSYRKK